MNSLQRPRPIPLNKSHSMGFTYIGVLAAIVIMGAVLGATVEVWHTAFQREKERELLFVGDQFRQAIGLYYRVGKKYPVSLEDLLKDPRQLTTHRYLRKIYHDPITGKAEWGLILGVQGEIIGVHSLSGDHPIKVSGFSAVNRDFNGAKKYSDWIFSYQVRQSSATAGKILPPVSGQGSKVQ
ncbi:MAG: type II secretion system protein [Methylotenera sp.]